MTAPYDRLWPSSTSMPLLRLIAALVLAPLIATAVVAALAFIVAGSSEPTQVGALAVTEDATTVFFGFAAIFMVIAVIPGIVLLWSFRQRHALVWFACGVVLGASSGFGLGLASGVETTISSVMGATSGGVLMSLVRLIAGIRAG